MVNVIAKHSKSFTSYEFIEQFMKTWQKNLASNFKFYALAMDESNDATNNVQFDIFIRGIDHKYDVFGEIASLVPLKWHN